MVDAARVPETMAYHKRVIEFCSDWELNTLHFRLTDDQGSAMRFTFRPRSCDPWKCIYPRRIKEPGGIWSKPRGRINPRGGVLRTHRLHHTFSRVCPSIGPRRDGGDAEFNGIIPVNPETLTLFGKLYREVAASLSFDLPSRRLR